jgi:hypothetical protein
MSRLSIRAINLNDPISLLISILANYGRALFKSYAVDKKIAVGQQLQCIVVEVWRLGAGTGAVTQSESLHTSIDAEQ